jgi:hypothetical protein
MRLRSLVRYMGGKAIYQDYAGSYGAVNLGMDGVDVYMHNRDSQISSFPFFQTRNFPPL